MGVNGTAGTGGGGGSAATAGAFVFTAAGTAFSPFLPLESFEPFTADGLPFFGAFIKVAVGTTFFLGAAGATLSSSPSSAGEATTFTLMRGSSLTGAPSALS